MNIREFVNERKLKRHKNNFLEVVHYNVYNDEELLKTFNWSVEKCGVSREMYRQKQSKKCLVTCYTNCAIPEPKNSFGVKL